MIHSYPNHKTSSCLANGVPLNAKSQSQRNCHYGQGEESAIPNIHSSIPASYRSGNGPGWIFQNASIGQWPCMLNQKPLCRLQQQTLRHKSINSQAVLMKDINKMEEQPSNSRQLPPNQLQRQTRIRSYRQKFLKRVRCRMQKTSDKMKETKSEERMECLHEYETDHSVISADYFDFQSLEQ